MNQSKRLSFEDRKKIEELFQFGDLLVEIARKTGFHFCTIRREFKKCAGIYNAEEAQKVTGKRKQHIDFEFIGSRYGKLVVESFVNIQNHRSWWRCQCDCGKKCIISRKILLEYCSSRRPLSCGCVAKQFKSKKETLPIEELMLRKWQDLMAFREVVEGCDCWYWKGYMQKGETPKTSWRSVSVSVRRIMYAISNGMVPDDLTSFVYTTCENKYCFNPEHLTLKKPYRKRGPYKKRT